MVVVVAVVIILAVRFIMLLVVANEIVQREAVVCGDKVDACIRPPAGCLVQVRTAGEPVSHLADPAFVAFPKTANFIAIFSVPLRPKHGKISHLITAVAHIPRFGD